MLHQNTKWLFWTKLAKKVLNRESEHDHRISQIQNRIVTKFQLKLAILNFWIKLTQKGISKKKDSNFVYWI